MCVQHQFTPIEPNPKHWPITKLHKAFKVFLAEVVRKSFESLRSRYPDAALYRMLEQTIARELARISSDAWACDPKDDRFFWQTMSCSIKNKMDVDANKMLQNIIERYVGEICSNFSVRHYQLMVKGVHYTFVNLLKPRCFGFGPKEKRWTLRYKRLQEKFHLMGKLDTVRSLAKKGTIILVPTHTSNWDSVIIGLAMKRLGLPPLSWGVGLNLFKNKGFRYFFSKMGTYRVDRRKKIVPYLQVQKDYACLTLERDCHTLFYPSGTRSRSGAIDSDLKLGLLSTPFEAQEHNFQKYGANARKLFIVPIVLNYHCVLEASQLIRESADPEYSVAETTKQDGCTTNLLLAKNILCKSSEIFINIGDPLDVMGNSVDAEGRSYEVEGGEIDLYSMFLNLAEKITTSKRPNEYVKTLSRKIVESYYRINIVLSSHLVAFVAYELAKTIEGFSMTLERMVLRYEKFMVLFAKVYKALYLLYEQKKIDLTPLLLNSQLHAIATDGLTKLGIYHAKPPLAVLKNGDIVIQEPWTLLYYHNRLMGYGLEKLFTQ